jgi:hypothetical protein
MNSLGKQPPDYTRDFGLLGRRPEEKRRRRDLGPDRRHIATKVVWEEGLRLGSGTTPGSQSW